MLTFKKRLSTIIFLTLFSAAIIVSCGKQGNTEEANSEEANTEQAASDSTEHPTDSAEHPADSTKNQ